jgi:hypothetical protein
MGSLWIWLVGLLLVSRWSWVLYGPSASAGAAWFFAVSPNLLAHGPLLTMEMPLLVASTAQFYLFWRFLVTERPRDLVASALVAGLAWSCKFTAIVFPPILGLAWWVDRRLSGETGWLRLSSRVVLGMVGYGTLMLVSDLAITGFATLPPSPTHGDHPSLTRWLGPSAVSGLAWIYEQPWPQDWVGFAAQLRHQASGGPSYLFGERRMTGWWYYYFVSLAVKVPLSFGLLLLGRLVIQPWRAAVRPGPEPGTVARMSHDGLLPLTIACFLILTAVGSSRNYGLRYLLPLSPLAIVWVSALAERGRWGQSLCLVGVAGAAIASASVHPYELTYFNAMAGGSAGGRQILADSNLDWGQGLLALNRLQHEQPQYRDLTLYYFGDTDPAYYGVAGTAFVVTATGGSSTFPRPEDATTAYVAVSASLQWGPWAPPSLFGTLDGIVPEAQTADTTIALYRTTDLAAASRRKPVGQ